MKTNITVGWAMTVEMDVDPSLLNDETYKDKVRNEAVKLAGGEINWQDGIVTDCEDFSQLVE